MPLWGQSLQAWRREGEDLGNWGTEMSSAVLPLTHSANRVQVKREWVFGVSILWLFLRAVSSRLPWLPRVCVVNSWLPRLSSPNFFAPSLSLSWFLVTSHDAWLRVCSFPQCSSWSPRYIFLCRARHQTCLLLPYLPALSLIIMGAHFFSHLVLSQSFFLVSLDLSSVRVLQSLFNLSVFVFFSFSPSLLLLLRWWSSFEFLQLNFACLIHMHDLSVCAFSLVFPDDYFRWFSVTACPSFPVSSYNISLVSSLSIFFVLSHVHVRTNAGLIRFALLLLLLRHQECFTTNIHFPELGYLWLPDADVSLFALRETHKNMGEAHFQEQTVDTTKI